MLPRRALVALVVLALASASSPARHFYSVLGVDSTASDAEIRKAYRKQSMLHHPDKNPHNLAEAQERFIEVAEAFETLGDERARKHYDQTGVSADDALRGQHAASSMHERLRRRFEEQMRRARENGEVTFTWGGGPDPFNRPKTCSRVAEGRSLSLRCPHEGSKIRRVRFASYGEPGGACSVDSASGPVAFVRADCHADSSVQAVEDQCLGKNSCAIKATNAVFGEPCYGRTKYLAVDVACDPPPPEPPTTCAMVREGKPLKLICPNGERVASVIFASWGTPQGKCRPLWGATVRHGHGDVASDLSPGDCEAHGAEEVLRGACVGKAQCSISAANDSFGDDPCYGTTKWLAAAVRCEAPPSTDKLEL